MIIKILILCFLLISGCNDTPATIIPKDIPHDPDFIKMTRPKRGDWLYYITEKLQSFDEYKNHLDNCKTAEKCVIYIQPFGELSDTYKKILPVMREYAEIFFNCKTILKEPIPICNRAFVQERSQYDAAVIMEELDMMRPKDAVAFIGITDKDLYIGLLGFVFGVGTAQGQLGVYSLKRLEINDWFLFLRRSLRLMSHEVGHIFSIPHCIAYKCLMNGSNTLEESDSRPLHICPIDLEKLKWNVGLDAKDWYTKLSRFYEKYQLTGESKWAAIRLGRITQ